MFYTTMSSAINMSNIDILTFNNINPLFEICGDVDKEETQWLIRDLIRAGVEPMVWGDKKLPYMVIKAGHGFALINKDGERHLIDASEVQHGDDVICLQTYQKSVSEEELAVLELYSRTLYGLPMESYTKEECLMMKNRLIHSLKKNRQRQVYSDKPGGDL